MLKIIREILLKIVNDIDTGNSNLSPEECEEVIEYLSGITNKNEKLIKYCKENNVTRTEVVREGIKKVIEKNNQENI